ncbi:MAG: acyltransferase family protein [Fimbriimonas sp.]
MLHFAIPLFLLASAVLLTGSLLRNPDWPRYTKRRFTRTLWPYFLWSVAYLGFRLAFLRVGSDTEWITRSYPLLGTVSGPRVLVDIPTLVADLAWGKVYYHLYFLVVLLQLAVLLPFVILSVRGPRLSFGAAVLGAVVGQIAVFLLQSLWLRVPYPASLVLWYVPSLVVGAWIGAHREAWTAIWPRTRGWIALGASVGAAIYLPSAIAMQSGRNIDGLLFNLGFSAYAFGVALLLLGYAPQIAETRIARYLAPLGRVSLAVFLIHPAILHLLSGPRITAILDRLPVSPLWSTLSVLVISYALARAAGWMRADRFLFGQSFRSPEPAPAPG